jgi:hypothetical protein
MLCWGLQYSILGSPHTTALAGDSPVLPFCPWQTPQVQASDHGAPSHAAEAEPRGPHGGRISPPDQHAPPARRRPRSGKRATHFERLSERTSIAVEGCAVRGADMTVRGADS